MINTFKRKVLSQRKHLWVLFILALGALVSGLFLNWRRGPGALPPVASCPYGFQDLRFPTANSFEELRDTSEIIVTGTLYGGTSPNRLTVDRVYKGDGLKAGKTIQLCPVDMKSFSDLGALTTSPRALVFLYGLDDDIDGVQRDPVWVLHPYYGVVTENESGEFDISRSIIERNPPPKDILRDDDIQQLFGSLAE